MTYSYTQISQYLRCPRSYRYRYLDGWKEKDSKASLCFGRCFEKALAALFQGEDPGAVLFKEWEAYRDTHLEFSRGDDWERVLRQGIGLLERFAQDNRIRIRQPQGNLQKKILRPLPGGSEFVAYVDAIGYLDGTKRLLEWKTTRLEPELYRQLCREVLERDGWRCQVCGRAEELQVHHIRQRSRLGDDAPKNLITLCVTCHQKTHRHLKTPSHFQA